MHCGKHFRKLLQTTDFHRFLNLHFQLPAANNLLIFCNEVFIMDKTIFSFT